MPSLIKVRLQRETLRVCVTQKEDRLTHPTPRDCKKGYLGSEHSSMGSRGGDAFMKNGFVVQIHIT